MSDERCGEGLFIFLVRWFFISPGKQSLDCLSRLAVSGLGLATFSHSKKQFLLKFWCSLCQGHHSSTPFSMIFKRTQLDIIIYTGKKYEN
jgi:hypothetical protein